MQIEVLEPNMHKFKEQLKTAKNIDDIITFHGNFLDECLKECLLTDQQLFKTITSINLRTHYFCRVIIRFFIKVQSDETKEKAISDDGFEEIKDDFETNPAKRRILKRKKEADVIKRNM